MLDMLLADEEQGSATGREEYVLPGHEQALPTSCAEKLAACAILAG